MFGQGAVKVRSWSGQGAVMVCSWSGPLAPPVSMLILLRMTLFSLSQTQSHSGPYVWNTCSSLSLLILSDSIDYIWNICSALSLHVLVYLKH